MESWENGLITSCFWEVTGLENGLIWDWVFYGCLLKLNKRGLEGVKLVFLSDLDVSNIETLFDSKIFGFIGWSKLPPICCLFLNQSHERLLLLVSTFFLVPNKSVFWLGLKPNIGVLGLF